MNAFEKKGDIAHTGDTYPTSICCTVSRPRYAQFYSKDEFCLYNMFNHHFFDGEVGLSNPLFFSPLTFDLSLSCGLKLFPSIRCSCPNQASNQVLEAFLTEAEGQKVVMVADPPFGGLVKPLASSFSQITQTWKRMQSPGNNVPPKPKYISYILFL